MADRYWRGGGGTWNTTTTANWSATSGGAGGASAPTSADNAIFDANSGLTASSAVTITGGVCADLTYMPTATVGQRTFNIVDSLTISGVLSTSGTAGNNRLRIRSNTLGIATNMVVATLGSISDVDFIDVYVTGTAAPLTGTRLGNIANGRGVTFSTPKTVYWNLAGTQVWAANGWAATSGGTPSTDYFPLVQDTAVFDNAGAVTSISMVNSSFSYYGTVDMSARTTAMTIITGTNNQIFGNWTNGSGTAFSGTTVILFLSRTTQTITSAGKTWFAPITVNTYGGTVQLVDSLNIGANALTVTSGTFSTANQALTAGSIVSNTAGPRSISLGASNVTLSSTTAAFLFTVGDGLTFDAGTSSVNLPAGTSAFPGANFTYYDVTVGGSTATIAVSGINTFNNLSISGLRAVIFSANQTINNNLTWTGTTVATSRSNFQSNVVGTPITLTINNPPSLVDIDFQDITVIGTAAPISGTRFGDVGGNSGITFTSKTVYWNLAGTQVWAANGWAATSGGTPAVANFPLPQDTAVFNNAGSVTGTITINGAYKLPSVDMSTRTTAMTLGTSTNQPSVYGDWTNGSGTTLTGVGVLTFVKRSGATITSASKTFTQGIVFSSPGGSSTIADALITSASAGVSILSGTFSSGTYNVTTPAVISTGTLTRRLNMGSGLWTLSSAGNIWTVTSTGLTLDQGTANILSNTTSTLAKTFAGGGFSYNTLTIGGTGVSTLTFTGANSFTELASTKTVAHTVALSATFAQTFGAWTITGTAGNLVTVSGASSHIIAGARVSGVDYLTMGTTSFSLTSPGEFYRGANSTGTGAGINTGTAPTPVTRYWVGGTGIWSATNTVNWSDASGGIGGFSVPTSADTVIFDSLSNATAYTVTCTATQLRCASLTMGAPLTGNITWAGTAPLSVHGNFSLTGGTNITRTYTGAITFSGSTTGNTINANGIVFGANVTVDGVGCGWTMTSALEVGSSSILSITRGSFNTNGYTLNSSSPTTGYINALGTNAKSISFGASTVYGWSGYNVRTIGLTFSAGTSTLYIDSFIGNNDSALYAGLSYYNVIYRNIDPAVTNGLYGANTFNNLTIPAPNIVDSTVQASLATIGIGTQTINGLFTVGGSTAYLRNSFDASGTTLAFVVNGTTSLSGIDFENTTITGTAVPVSGVWLSDLGGNSGVTTDAPKTVYRASNGGVAWETGWSTTSGGTSVTNLFPLAQDTIVFDNSSSNTAINTQANQWNIGTINMSARTNALTISGGNLRVYGDWVYGSGITFSTGAMSCRRKSGTQTITSAGKTFFGVFLLGAATVQLLDALQCTSAFGVSSTTSSFDANNKNVTCNDATLSGTVVMGSGTWTMTGTETVWYKTTGVINAGTSTILLSNTSTTARSFIGGGATYNKLTIGGATGASTTSLLNNSTFGEIASTKTVAATIALGSTIQTVETWTAAGTAGNLLTVSGTSAASPAYLVLTGAPNTNAVDYLNITNVRATPLDTTWYAGANSVNNGSLGWIFENGAGVTYAGIILEAAASTDAVAALSAFFASLGETATATDANATAASFAPSIGETATATDADSATLTFSATLAETATATDLNSSLMAFYAAVVEIATALDTLIGASGFLYAAFINEVATATDNVAAFAAFAAATNEMATATDVTGSSAAFAPLVNETVTATDAASVSAAFATLLAESATATDFLLGGQLYLRAIAETATASDATTTSVTFLGSVNETSTGTDATSSAYLFFALVSETATATDSLTTIATFNALAAETATATEDINAPGSIYNTAVLVAVTITDNVIGAYLWNPIDDNQTPSWQNVNDAQTPGWSTVPTPQTPAWTSIIN